MRNMYIAECDKQGGVSQYALFSDGRTEFIKRIPADRPMYLVKNNGKLYVLLRAAYEGEISGLSVYKMDEEERPAQLLQTVPVHGKCGCHLCVTDEGAVYVANYLSGSVVKLPGTVVTHTGACGPDGVRQDRPHVHYTGQTPDERYILAADLGEDSITVYDKDLKEVFKTYVPPGSGARHLAFSEDGNTLFCINELASSVSAFAYKDGKLDILDTVSIIPNGFCGKNTAAAIRVSGNFIYASNRGHNSITCLAFTNKKLKVLSITPCGGKGPRDFNLFDNILVCTNEDSNNVTFFKVNGEKLQKIENELYLQHPLCVIS